MSSGYSFFIDYVKYLLKRFCKKNFYLKGFHQVKINEINNFWEKICANLKIDDQDFYYAALLLYKLDIKNFKLNYINMYEFTLGVVLISHKFNDDFSYDNISWVNTLDFSLAYINNIEKKILKLLDYRIYLSKFKYDTYLLILKKKINRGSRFKNIICFTRKNHNSLK